MSWEHMNSLYDLSDKYVHLCINLLFNLGYFARIELIRMIFFSFNLQVEATEVFFSVTKLFQSRDIGLRRMVYLIIKELSPSADEV